VTPELTILDDMDRMTYDFMLDNLTGITDEELDWRPHPEGNPVRYIRGTFSRERGTDKAAFDPW
jgi:hypothetical protein